MGRGGRIRMTARGADKLKLPEPASVTWAVNGDAPVYAR
jgi:hypothetical protein